MEDDGLVDDDFFEEVAWNMWGSTRCEACRCCANKRSSSRRPAIDCQPRRGMPLRSAERILMNFHREGATMIKLFYSPHACRSPRTSRWRGRSAMRRSASTSARASSASRSIARSNPKGRVPALVTDAGILTETPGHPAFIAQGFRRPLFAPLDDPFALPRCRLSKLPLFHGACGARASRSRQPLGRRSDRNRRNEAKGSGGGHGLFRSHRTEMFKGRGDGRRLYDLRSYLFTVSDAGGRWRRSVPVTSGRRSPHPYVAAVRVRKAIRRRARIGCNAVRFFGLDFTVATSPKG